MTLGVVIASYGGESWRQLSLKRAYASASAQNPDELAWSYQEEGPISRVRNEAAAQVKTDWLLFLDADDELAPGYIDAMKKEIEEVDDTSRLLVPHVSYVRRGGHEPVMCWPRQDPRDGNWMVIGTVVSREVFEEVGGFRDYGWSEDWDLWARCQMLGAAPVEVPDAVYIAHANEGSRNRTGGRSWRLYWHQRIGHDNWPDDYESPTPQEDASCALSTRHLRRS